MAGKALCLLMLVGAVVCEEGSGITVTDGDQEETKDTGPVVEIVSIGDEFTLNCKKADGDDQSVYTWEKQSNNKTGDVKADSFTAIDTTDDRYSMNKDNTKLTIKKAKSKDFGLYRCLEDSEVAKQFEVTQKVKFRLSSFKKSYSVDVGDDTGDKDMRCQLSEKSEELVKGGTGVVFEWYERDEGTTEATPEQQKLDLPGTRLCGILNSNCEEDKTKTIIGGERIIKSETGLIHRSRLFISNVTLARDRKIFVCRARVNGTTLVGGSCEKDPFCDQIETILRVKDPLAAIYPFLGIVAEVIILCVIIFFCERRREANKGVDEDEDEGFTGNNSAGSNSNVRQRK